MKIQRHIFSICMAFALSAAPIAAVAAEAQQPEASVRQDTPQVKVRAGGITIDLPGDASQRVQIYALTGQVVKQFDVAPGQTFVELPAGYYIVRICNTTVKVAVK